MPGKELSSPCVDCHDVESILTVRSRRLCRNCFVRYAGGKIVRRMEKFRRQPKSSQYKLLLPLSYGVSSSVLLHMVYAQLERQRANTYSPTGFDLQVLVVEPSTISAFSPACEERFETVQKAFPAISFTQVSFHSIFEFDPNVLETLQEFAGSSFVDDPSLPALDRLEKFRRSITTSTSRTDVDNILLIRLVVAFAKASGCQTILWGDSDSRLAAKALANVAKGRGSSLTWQVSDGISPWGIEFEYPMRDLFKTELDNYANLFPEVKSFVIPDAPISENILTKNLSIDELMMRYVQTQGEKYPGVMANVARTASKLQASELRSGQCKLCGASTASAEGLTGGTTISEEREIPRFCLGCARSRPMLDN
ncbi:hypothetical protein ASPZODRAFT_57478 [Penicilliopsis zonata CBS 506.65]|uniref:Cytoplasmic tRNA 2-thiolation protein 2 n=1 Tax=Penicilliopsis zonata CBS 506.65 TaxID=1073090 RepID=A0A1L9SV92_9EURO|nr:hypothetical protein ASPZODRAFT_57478 [Penicilliopsis zonata CBS 506.65]OJJ50987.1 hypothetical protein ASPZODRAFT_57478 [Penicilliopsis zonata CBS 506.65]